MDLGKSAEGKETAIGAALEDVLRRESGKRLAGVVLLSDGAQQAYAPRDTQPQVPARRLNDLPAPLFTVTFGQDRSATQSRDVALSDLVCSPSVFIKNELSVAGTARINGLVNQADSRAIAVRNRARQAHARGHHRSCAPSKTASNCNSS